jgi:pyrroline-5-carboxylate reductase
MKYDLAVLGAGNMAEAIVRGILSAGIMRAERIVAADPVAARRVVFESLGISTHNRAGEVAKDARAILLSIKPQMMNEVLSEISPVLSSDVPIISIAAGTRTDSIESRLRGDVNWRVVRVMPNTPMLVGEGASGICPGRHATKDDIALARRLFESAGVVTEVTEERMDAVTALSGSGPAYFFYLVEQMIAAGEKMGLTADQSSLLARKTALGAAKMLMTSSDPPQELRRKVTSPNGTTHAAITHMESQNVDQIIIDAILRAEARGKELGSK